MGKNLNVEMRREKEIKKQGEARNGWVLYLVNLGQSFKKEEVKSSVVLNYLKRLLVMRLERIIGGLSESSTFGWQD